jgi:toxin ParE1/3/4
VRRYRLSREARADLEAIWAFIAKDNADAADRFIDRVTEKFKLLTRRPAMGRSCDELFPGLKRFAVGRYLIFYRTGPGVLDVLRVLHGARDIKKLFGD